jgi:5-methylcytosine-specific restriction protein A
MNTDLPFIPDFLYNRRRDLHLPFGGNYQNGISPVARFPYIFIFTTPRGSNHGYADQWDNENVFSYTGEGQTGDMQFTRGNLALRDSRINGKRIFLFESAGNGMVKFISELEFLDFDYFATPDNHDNLRRGIKFFLKRVGVSLPAIPNLPKLLEEPAVEYDTAGETEKYRFVNSRVGQGAYRKRIIHRWNYRCAVTGYSHLEVLIASHIIPWAECTDQERLDVNNGILLSPTYDALFDRHLITFDAKGKIHISDKLEPRALELIGVTGSEQINHLNKHNVNYLERHSIEFQKRINSRLI